MAQDQWSEAPPQPFLDQEFPNPPPSDDWGNAPIIAAPDLPGRAAPDARMPPPPEPGGFNGFLPGEVPPPPPMEDFQPPALPVVVELFTSQGCSTCPPADAMLSQLAGEPGVLPLSFHVDYWDYLGWADEFAQPAFTQRQEAYAHAQGERSVYTPQMIVDGYDTAVAPGPAQLMALIDANRFQPAMLSVQRKPVKDGEVIELVPLSDLGGPVDISLVRYVPERQVEMTAGENRGRTVTYTNVVLALDELANWNGVGPLRLTVRPEDAPDMALPADTRHVLLVQKELGPHKLPGPILAAIELD